MKKNLKKLISAVIALAVAGSMIPASFAAKATISDIEGTACENAVNTLVALNVINGYEDEATEDGAIPFKPENNITRAEVTKVVVAALNQTKSAEGMTGSTQFTDVAADFWANGFINAGVQIGFIEGMGDGTFAPSENVTYAQIVKMLVASMGYEDYAQFMGGWPNGYLSIANAEGITDGVKLGANDIVTRGQVAQLVYNALLTPVVEQTGLTYTDSGKLAPTIEKQDGKKDGVVYKTLLTEKFDAYVVEGRVTETSKGGSLEAGEVNFAIEKSEKYEDEDFRAPGTILAASAGDTDIENYINVYGQAIVAVDEDDNVEFVSFIPSGKNKSVVVEADLYKTKDEAADTNTGFKVEFYKNEDTTQTNTYKIRGKETFDENGNSAGYEAVKLYVNGYEVNPLNDDAFNKYVANNKTGSIELVDSYKTDGYYDVIYATYYDTAKVSYVNGTKITLVGKNTGYDFVTNLNFDIEKNEDLNYNIYMDGKEVDYTELKKDDIVSIAYNPTATDATEKATTFDLYVARETVTGAITRTNEAKAQITVAGTAYKFVKNPTDWTAFKPGNDYVLYLDYFGRIAETEVNSINVNYAIVDKVTWSETKDAYVATIYTAEGVVKTYDVDGTKAEVEANLLPLVYSNVATKAKKDVQDRVFTYKVKSSTGEFTSYTQVDPTARSTDFVDDSNATGKFTAKTNKIAGGIKLDEATKIVDAEEYKHSDKVADLGTLDLGKLVDEVGYRACAYGDDVTGAHPFVIIIKGEAPYTTTIRVAVISEVNGQETDEVGDYVYSVDAMYMGEEVTFTISDEAIVNGCGLAEDEDIENVTFQKGDVIVFQTNAKGYLDDIQVVFTAENLDNFANFNAAVLAATNVPGAGAREFSVTDAYKLDVNDDDFSTDFSVDWAQIETADKVQLVFGPVVDTDSSKYFDIAKLNVAGGKTSTDLDDASDYISIDMDDATTVYTYAVGDTKSPLEVASIGSIQETIMNAENVTEVVWASNVAADVTVDTVYYALALVVDGEAIDVVVFEDAE